MNDQTIAILKATPSTNRAAVAAALGLTPEETAKVIMDLTGDNTTASIPEPEKETAPNVDPILERWPNGSHHDIGTIHVHIMEPLLQLDGGAWKFKGYLYPIGHKADSMIQSSVLTSHFLDALVSMADGSATKDKADKATDDADKRLKNIQGRKDRARQNAIAFLKDKPGGDFVAWGCRLYAGDNAFVWIRKANGLWRYRLDNKQTIGMLKPGDSVQKVAESNLGLWSAKVHPEKGSEYFISTEMPK